tara:strand:- start:1191 stop:1739 length:549 start_codon:yes stop_codon:yes gene_type:complete
MESPLSVLLRNGDHADAGVRLALKAEQFSVAVARSPTQLAVPGDTAAIQEANQIDYGINKTTITISGIIDNVPTDKSQTASGVFYNMEILSLTPSGGSAANYYIPNKNYLEEFLMQNVTDPEDKIQLEVGDATTPTSSSTTVSTGGGIYTVAASRFQFTLSPGREDRWVYNIQFTSTMRKDT